MTTADSLLISLITAHLLGDFILQTDAEVDAKAHLSIRHHVAHALKTVVVTYTLVGCWAAWWQISALVFLSHFIIDLLKVHGLQRRRRQRRDGALTVADKLEAFLFDQYLHVAALTGLACYLVATGALPAAGGYWVQTLGSGWNRALLLVSGSIVAVPVGGCVITILVEPFLAQLKEALKGEDLKPERRGLENGGRIIGWLERGLIFLFVVTTQPAAVGFLVTAKSIFRFGELKDPDQRMEAEYIIIGTLMSFGWALACAWLTVWVLKSV